MKGLIISWIIYNATSENIKSSTKISNNKLSTVITKTIEQFTYIFNNLNEFLDL